MVDRFEKFSFAISEIYRYWHRIAADVMEEHGLKGPYAVYFTTLYQYESGVTAARLAEICARDKADVSRAMGLLEKKGLVVKNGDYRACVRLTEEGKRLAEIINEKAKAAVEYVGKDLGDKNREIFYDCLEKITANLQILSEEGL